MVSPRRRSLSRDDYIAAAIRFVDAHGLTALTLRALGDSLGVAHTALYRHFRDKDELVVAMKDSIIVDVATRTALTGTTPRDRLIELLDALHEAFLRHPHVVAAMTSVATVTEHAHDVAELVIAELEALGLRGEQLTQCFQMLESFVIGTQAFDLSGAPEHLELRRQRHRSLGHPDFEMMTRTCAGVAANNDAAFQLGLVMLVDGCVVLAARHASAPGR